MVAQKIFRQPSIQIHLSLFIWIWDRMGWILGLRLVYINIVSGYNMTIFQDCEMKFGSWTYNGFKVNFMLQQDYGDISTFIANGEWALLGTTQL